MGVIVGDPLVDDIRATTTWPRNNQGRCLLCDVPDCAQHRDDCKATPLFALVVSDSEDYLPVSDLFGDIARDFADINFSIEQHLVKCAECGKFHFGKDLDVIYQASLNGPSKHKYPTNIIKAVCPEHNRVGSVSYGAVPPSGIGTY